MMVSCGRMWPPRRLPSGSVQTAWQCTNGLPSAQPKVAFACSIRLQAKADQETNFTVFQPSGMAVADADGILARVKPNEDILSAVETICRENHVTEATVRGSLGSLIGARFSDGDRVDDHATEVLVRQGWVRNGKAALELLVVDMKGDVYEGWLERGENPVCITFDLLLEAVA